MAFNVLTPRLIVPHLTLLSGPFCAISYSLGRSLYPPVVELVLFFPGCRARQKNPTATPAITFTLELSRRYFLLSGLIIPVSCALTTAGDTLPRRTESRDEIHQRLDQPCFVSRVDRGFLCKFIVSRAMTKDTEFQIS